MPSDAFRDHFKRLIADSEELILGYSRFRDTGLARRPGLMATNRAIVVMAVSAWESYVEELMRESVLALKPPAPPLGAWPALQAYASGLIGNFNTPSPANVDRLVRSCLGLPNVSDAWAWRGSTPAQSAQRLAGVLALRHQIAHGVNPRPTVHHQVSSDLPPFFRRLARCTDAAVRDYLVRSLGIAAPWPA